MLIHFSTLLLFGYLCGPNPNPNPNLNTIREKIKSATAVWLRVGAGVRAGDFMEHPRGCQERRRGEGKKHSENSTEEGKQT